MKKLALFLLPLLAWPALGAGNPFRTRFVCVPAVAPDLMALEFRVRDRGQCAEGERYLEVHPQADGSTLLLPPQNLPSPEERQDAERYRKYFGGEGVPAN